MMSLSLMAHQQKVKNEEKKLKKISTMMMKMVII
jgi:hypothetical protein